MKSEDKLRILEERICRAVCSIHGHVTKAEIESLEKLRKIVGKSWDAINGQWKALED